MLLGIAIACVGYWLGRMHERDIVATWPDAALNDARLARPLVTVTDGGRLEPSDDTELIYAGRAGRHRAKPAFTFRAVSIRPLLADDPRLEAIDA